MLQFFLVFINNALKGEDYLVNIYIINPSFTMKSHSKADCLVQALGEQFDKYDISWSVVNNATRYFSKIEKDCIIIIFNNESFSEDENVKKLLCIAKNKNAVIYPIAMDKETRKPLDIIADKQSYDVWEQLRYRDLSDDYLPLIARCFARKLIAEIMPTMYSESGLIFVSHRRLDGEEITAQLCDVISIQFKTCNTFRDVTDIKVGEEAQSEIDKAMSRSDAFVFIHTPESAESEWIQKELRFAILRNIPVLWVQIDYADINKLKIVPSEKPHLSYGLDEFKDRKRVTEIATEIMDRTFDLIMTKSNAVFDYHNVLEEMFEDKIKCVDSKKIIFKIDVKRKGYRYPQRDINQYVQLFGRTPTLFDVNCFNNDLKILNDPYDSSVILTDKIVKSVESDNLIIESYEDFMFHWDKYLQNPIVNKNKEIVISGAFSDGEEIYKQTLTDALVIFAKSILKSGYTLTFGSHPTFQELFFEISSLIDPENYKNRLKMYISKWFEDKYTYSKDYYKANSEFNEIEKESTLNKSLTNMRKEMIQRKEVSALICLGGKIKQNKLEEGIREEISLARDFKIPVFIVGSVGGCSSKVALEYKADNWTELNDAPEKLNTELMESIDYFSLSQNILNYLKNKLEEDS